MSYLTNVSGLTGVSGPAAGIIDSFEDVIYADQNQSLSDLYGGDLSQFARQTQTVLEGAETLEASANNNNFYGLVSTSGLPAYPQQGETVRARLQGTVFESSDSSAQLGVGWMTQSVATLPDGYAVRLRGDNQYQLEYWSGGGNTFLDTTAATAEPGTTYEVQITHEEDGNIQAKLLDDSVAERDFDGQRGDTLGGVDTQYTSGGIWWFINQGGSSTERYGYYDIYEKQESWVNYRSYESTNPVIEPGDNADADNEQYDPAVIELPSGGYAMYVKSDELASNNTLLRLYESSDGVSWQRQSTTIGPSDTSASDATSTPESQLIYNPDDSTFYLWTRVDRSNNPTEVRLFTGSSHDSLSETSNPVKLTTNDFSFKNPPHCYVSDVIKHNGTVYVYGTASGDSWYGTMSSFADSITPQGEIVGRADDYEEGSVVQYPGIFQRPDGNFVLSFAVGGSSDITYNRQVYTAIGSDPTSFNPKNDIAIPAKDGSWRERWVYGIDWLKENDGHNKTLQTINGKHRAYFNAQPTGTANAGSIGLAYFSDYPSFSP